MWVCLNNSFVSIVEDFNNKDYVLVRGRRLEDVGNFVGDGYTIIKTDKRDYRYRTSVAKTELPNMLARAASNINYSNFKASVNDKALSQFYGEVWISGVRNLDTDWVSRRY